METRQDERGVIVTWMARIVVWFAIVGVLLFDVSAIMVNYVGLESSTRDVANSLAREIAQERSPSNQTQLVASARSLTRAAGARLMNVRIDPEGVLHVRTKRSANTLIVSRVEALREWGRATATARAATSPRS
jgi:hypothetical protein